MLMVLKPGKKNTIRDNRNQYDHLDEMMESLRDIGENPMARALRAEWESEKSGMGSDINIYLRSCEQASAWVRDDPDILDEYAMEITPDGERDRDKYDGRTLEAVEQIVYYRANPWKLLMNVVGRQKLNRTTAEGNVFRGFYTFQKRYLRDLLDPRVFRMIFTACRGGAKTWLTAVGMYADEYLNPFLKLMVISGSLRQSDNLYSYYSTIAEGTPYMRLVKPRRFLKRKTETVAGGWIESFPASEKKTHGPRPDKVFIDEACKAESDHIHGSTSAAMTSHNIKFVYTSTPDKMVHLFMDNLREAKRQRGLTPKEYDQIPPYLRWKYYELTAHDCPWIPPQNVRLMTDMYGGKNTHLYKIYVLGQPAPAEGSVFQGDRIQAHIIDSMPKKVTIELPDGEKVEEEIRLHSHTTGFDLGGNHPTVVIEVAEDQNGDCYVIHDEDIVNRTEEYKVDRLVKVTSTHSGRAFLDAAPIQYHANRKIQLGLDEYNLGAVIVPFSNNKMPMISNVRGFLEAETPPDVWFPKRLCEPLVNQLYEYSYQEGVYDEKPMKGNDDHIDAFLLAMWGHRYTFLNKKYIKGASTIYNMAEHLEDVDVSPFMLPPWG